MEYLDGHIENGWVKNVMEGKTLVRRGKEAAEQINILGDDGVPVEYHEMFWKSELVDFVILQQDAFDDIDANCPIERQKFMFDFVMEVCRKQYGFVEFEECSAFFKNLINLFKQLNYTVWQSEEFAKYESEIRSIVASK